MEMQIVNLKEHLKTIELEFIEKALVNTLGNKNKASKLLGLNRTTLVEKLRKYGLLSKKKEYWIALTQQISNTL